MSNNQNIKPVKLQINTAGAWRNVIAFDASDEDASNKVLEASPVLAGVGQATLRIVIDDGLQEVLTHWTPDKGWQPWRR